MFDANVSNYYFYKQWYVSMSPLNYLITNNFVFL